MCESMKEYEIDRTYLIIRNYEVNKILQECRLREWWYPSGAYIISIVKKAICLSRGLVVPLVIHNCLVILLRVMLEKMLSEICIRGASVIKIIDYIPGDVSLIGAITFAGCVLEDGVMIRKTILTCTTCRLSAPFRWTQWQLEIQFPWKSVRCRGQHECGQVVENWGPR